MSVTVQPAAGVGVSDQVRKSQRLDTGEYVPASQMSSADRRKMMAEMKRRKALGLSSQQFWRQRAAADPVRRSLSANALRLRQLPVSFGVSPADPDNEFGRAFRARIRSGGYPGALSVRGMGVAAGVGAHPGGLQLVVNDPLMGVIPGRVARHSGTHEGAHFATDSQVRRGRTRNPYRLEKIRQDALKSAREEARADATAARVHGRGWAGSGSAYELKSHWQQPGQWEAYQGVRRAAGQAVPRGMAARRGLRRLGRAARTNVRRNALGYGTYAGGVALLAASQGYESLRRRKDPYYALPWTRNSSYERQRRAKLRAQGVSKAQGVVHERQVHPLEHRFERQRRLGRAAAEGGLSLSSGDYEYLPVALGSAGVRRKRPPLRRAYVSRKDPRWFDRVEYASTDDPQARLHVHGRSGWDVAGRRGLQAGQVGAAAGAAGLLLGSRRVLKDPRALMAAARSGSVKSLLPSRRGLKVAGGLAAVGGVAGGLWRPSPVAVSYRRPAGG